ncbi:hypothetical protein SOCEGT47_014780 [Sorangium cellulosum]|uniref:Secreted protein n=1 Tax=Sorangium cellulosum TaxID=56 RepID=A0A4P2PWD4_SORCE|nr:hypothetical protein [Sorangium cellulosum]AUX21000.1 hypothetical protein SOCEGT47_014780 [Sorangium cellulosum]
MSAAPPPGPRRAAPRLALLLLAGAGAAAGCDDVSRFSTAEGEAYCGAITLGGAFRAGLSPRVQMRLELDADALDGPESPGALWTYEAPDGATPERRLLDGAQLRPIGALAHDPLSRLQFGDGRERNAVVAVSASDPGAEPLLAIVSLRTDASVEVRLLRPGHEEPASGEALGAGQRQIFGVFRLTRRSGTCGF